MNETVLVAKFTNISFELAERVVKLFNEDATIPFLVRYRKHLIEDLTSDDLRFIKQMLETAKSVVKKAESIVNKISAKGELTPDLKRRIDNAHSVQELDDIFEPYKTSKKSKISVINELGFDVVSKDLLCSRKVVNPVNLVNVKNELIKDKKKVTDLLVEAVGNLIVENEDFMNFVYKRLEIDRIMLTCNQAKVDKNKESNDKCKASVSDEKFENYYNFSNCYKSVKPHQILAINRGENKGMLKAQVQFPDSFFNALDQFVRKKWPHSPNDEFRSKLFVNVLKYVTTGKIVPKLRRRIRSDLTARAKKAALDVFSSNLKWLLLTRPIHPSSSYVVLGIDPGFKNGCKIAVVNVKRDVLHLQLLNLNSPGAFKNELRALIEKYNIQTIAIGNGIGCRQAEVIVSNLIAECKLNVQYVIVSEQGVSIYSCSKEAKEEYPNMKENFISAVSLVKRHFDPLSELVKVEPRHLGVGMYQHDIEPSKLDKELGEVVSDCVSNVGVDVNTAPLALLKYIAGLSDSRAKNIIQTRDKVGSFISRKQLMDVKGIGPKTFQQLAGFVKIVPETCFPTEKSKSKKAKFEFNTLDQTIIHPDDYKKANQIMKMAGVDSENIGTTPFINNIKNYLQKCDIAKVAESIECPVPTVELILTALSSPLDHDIRSTMNAPLFKKNIISMDDLKLGSIVTGRVENVTPFGSFIDIGIGKSGLIPTHFSKNNDLHLGQRVSVKITEIRGEKVSLHLLSILHED